MANHDQYIPTWEEIRARQKQVLKKELNDMVKEEIRKGNFRFQERSGRDMRDSALSTDNQRWSELTDDEIEERKRKIIEDVERKHREEAYPEEAYQEYVETQDHVYAKSKEEFLSAKPEPYMIVVVRNREAVYPEMEFLGGVWVLVVPFNSDIEFLQ